MIDYDRESRDIAYADGIADAKDYYLNIGESEGISKVSNYLDQWIWRNGVTLGDIRMRLERYTDLTDSDREAVIRELASLLDVGPRAPIAVVSDQIVYDIEKMEE